MSSSTTSHDAPLHFSHPSPLLDASPGSYTPTIALYTATAAHHGINPVALGRGISHGHRYLQRAVVAEICEPLCDIPDPTVVESTTDDAALVTAGSTDGTTQTELGEYLAKLYLDSVNAGINSAEFVSEIQAICDSDTETQHDRPASDVDLLTVINQVCRPILCALSQKSDDEIDRRNEPAVMTARGFCDIFNWSGGV